MKPRSVDELEGTLIDPNAVTFGVETSSLLPVAIKTTTTDERRGYPYTPQLATTTAFVATNGDCDRWKSSHQYHQRMQATIRRVDDGFSNWNFPMTAAAVAKVTTNVENQSSFSPNVTRNIVPLEYFEYSNVKDEKNNHDRNIHHAGDTFHRDTFQNHEFLSLLTAGGDNDQLESYSTAHASSISIKAQIGSDVGRLLAVEEQDKVKAVNRLVVSNPYHEKLRIDAAKKIARQKERQRHQSFLENNRQLSCGVHASSISIKTQIGSDIGRQLAMEELNKIKTVNRLITSKKLRIDAAEKIAREKERQRNQSFLDSNRQWSCRAHASSVSIKVKIGSNIGRQLAMEEIDKVKTVNNRLITSSAYHEKLRIDAAEKIARQKERERNNSLLDLEKNKIEMVALV